jgi:maltooligosyltrehalose synthase
MECHIYPILNNTFEIHTNAGNVQLRACISQKGNPLVFYSRKSNPLQTRYASMEIELLSIVETMEEFKKSFGKQIKVYTVHAFLTYKNFTSDRVMIWRLFIEV